MMREPVTFISDIEQQKERTQKGRTEEKNKGYNVETKKLDWFCSHSGKPAVHYFELMT